MPDITLSGDDRPLTDYDPTTDPHSDEFIQPKSGFLPEEYSLTTAARATFLAEKLLVASYGAGLPLQGEDVRCVVRAARLFYDEVEHPTDPAAEPKAAEADDGE